MKFLNIFKKNSQSNKQLQRSIDTENNRAPEMYKDPTYSKELFRVLHNPSDDPQDGDCFLKKNSMEKKP